MTLKLAQPEPRFAASFGALISATTIGEEAASVAAACFGSLDSYFAVARESRTLTHRT